MRLRFFLGVILLVVGCQNIERPEKPKNLIPEEKMIDIYVESYLSNAARSVDNRRILAYGLQLDSVLYERFSIDSIQYEESNRYYSSQLEKYEQLFKEVHKRLNKQKNKIDSVVEIRREERNIEAASDSEEIDTTESDARLTSPVTSQEADSSKN